MKMSEFLKKFPNEDLKGYAVGEQKINQFGEVEGIVLKAPEISGLFSNRSYVLYFGEDTEIGDYK